MLGRTVESSRPFATGSFHREFGDQSAERFVLSAAVVTRCISHHEFPPRSSRRPTEEVFIGVLTSVAASHSLEPIEERS
jgi:hypothetical protein